ncbi:hypothetical protein FKP32DRAFT_1588868 [Trametes sanguinea]|nr:hypothetical protein FKP32DRAFT_1588868 [Trametes sanguinea]
MHNAESHSVPWLNDAVCLVRRAVSSARVIQQGSSANSRVCNTGRRIERIDDKRSYNQKQKNKREERRNVTKER